MLHSTPIYLLAIGLICALAASWLIGQDVAALKARVEILEQAK